jgi:hypothetical protein
MRDDEAIERAVETVEHGRQLARRLARSASDIADTFDRIAAFHERVAETEGHPLREHAAAFASDERRLASQEREQAIRLGRIGRGERFVDLLC